MFFCCSTVDCLHLGTAYCVAVRTWEWDENGNNQMARGLSSTYPTLCFKKIEYLQNKGKYAYFPVELRPKVWTYKLSPREWE